MQWADLKLEISGIIFSNKILLRHAVPYQNRIIINCGTHRMKTWKKKSQHPFQAALVYRSRSSGFSGPLPVFFFFKIFKSAILRYLAISWFRHWIFNPPAISTLPREGKAIGITDFINPKELQEPVHKVTIRGLKTRSQYSRVLVRVNTGMQICAMDFPVHSLCDSTDQRTYPISSVQAIKKVTGGGGVDYSFECSGNLQVLREAFLSTQIVRRPNRLSFISSVPFPFTVN